MKVTNLKCEYLENPLGLDEMKPRLGWHIESELYNVKQRSFHLQVTTDPNFSTIVWDSGELESSESATVRYAGPSLAARTRYYWRVSVSIEGTAPKTGDPIIERSPWSGAAWFETSISNAEWQGEFVTAENDGSWFDSRGTRLRKPFSVRGPIVSARVYATALGLYELRINGADVGDEVFAPGWTAYDKRMQYQTYDVTALLRTGDNVIGATLGAGWYKGDIGFLGRRNVYGGKTALLAQLVVRYEDGREEVVATDPSWRCSDGPILSSEFYNGEVYDARLEAKGWDSPGFDDSDWRFAALVEYDKTLLMPRDGVAVKRQEIFRPKLLTTPRGERVLDFGQNIAGKLRFKVRGPAGSRVTVRHAETLDAEGNFYTANLRRAKARLMYVLSGNGEEAYEPHFTFMGFRFVAIDDWPGQINPDDFEAVAIYSDMKVTGAFESSNELLNQLHKNIGWGLRGNFLDIPTDCPQRDERLGWTGDAQVFAGTAAFLMNSDRFFRKWLRDLALEAGPEGRVPYVVPNILVSRKDANGVTNPVDSACGWSDAVTICPWAMYVAYGDRDLLEEQYPAMRAWVERVRSLSRDGLLWDSGFHFGDWVALDAKEGSYFGATPNDYTATAFYAKSTQLLAKSALVLGKTKDAASYGELYQRILEVFRGEFFSNDGEIKVRTQTACAIALDFELVPSGHRDKVRDTLVDLIKENGSHLVTGFLGTPYLCRALSGAGAVDTAYSLLMREEYPSWLYQVRKGATTIWEHWDGLKPDGSMWSSDMNSFNHYAYGSIGQWMHETVAGIAPDETQPGYKRIIFKPVPGGGLTRASASIDTNYGIASITWETAKAAIDIELMIPPNANALFFPPSGGPSLQLGSGIWRFSYPWA